MGKLFGTDGIRGVANEHPMTAEMAIEEIVFANNLHTIHPSPFELSKAYRMEDARGRYIVFLKHAFPKECSLERTGCPSL